MNEQDEINPYAAPQSEPLTDRPVEERLKQPASVKWMMGLLIIAVITTTILHAQLFPEHRWRLWTDYPVGTAFDVSKFIACFAMLFGGRRAWVYWVTMVPQISFVMTGVQMLLRGWPELFRVDPLGKLVESVFLLLFFYLVYRFTFGLPSRIYFRIAKVDAEVKKE